MYHHCFYIVSPAEQMFLSCDRICVFLNFLYFKPCETFLALTNLPNPWLPRYTKLLAFLFVLVGLCLIALTTVYIAQMPITFWPAWVLIIWSSRNLSQGNSIDNTYQYIYRFWNLTDILQSFLLSRRQCCLFLFSKFLPVKSLSVGTKAYKVKDEKIWRCRVRPAVL